MEWNGMITNRYGETYRLTEDCHWKKIAEYDEHGYKIKNYEGKIMRDLNRIYRYCHELAEIWSKVPDWRFGQFILNMERACRVNTGKDVFYLEDDEFFKFMHEYFKEIKNES